MSKSRKLLIRGVGELRRDPTIAMLILANLFVLLDNGRAGRPVAAILVVYWMQMLIIGFWTCVKLAVIGRFMSLLTIPVFLVMYLSLVNTLGFVVAGMINGHLRMPLETGFDPRGYFLWGGAAFAAVHGASFFRNFLGKREHGRVSWENQIALPLMRALPMWIAATLAAMIGNIFGSIELTTMLVVPVKILLDVTGHTLEHLILADLPRSELKPEPT